MKLGVFGDLRLQKDDAFLRVETGGQVVDHDLDAVLGDGAGVGVVAGQRVPVGDEVETVEGRIVLQADPVLQRAEIVADVQAAGGTHAADYALCFCFCSGCQSLSLQIFGVRPSCLRAAAYAVLNARPLLRLTPLPALTP